MKAIGLFRENGYKQKYNDDHCVIYELENREEREILPDTIIIRKGSKEVILQSDYIEERTSLGTVTFGLNKELIQAINKKIEEIED